MSRTIRTITEEQEQEKAPEKLLLPSAVAEQLAMSEGALAQLRFTGKGPAFHKVSGRAVRYLQSDVTAWLQTTKKTSTQR